MGGGQSVTHILSPQPQPQPYPSFSSASIHYNNNYPTYLDQQPNLTIPHQAPAGLGENTPAHDPLVLGLVSIQAHLFLL